MQRISSSQSGQHHVQWPRACPGTGEEQPACSQPPPPLTLPSPSHQPQQLMDGPGLTQIAQGAQVQLQHPGTPITVRERRPSQPHTQSGGTIHHLGPQSPAAAGGAGLQPLASPSHITTANLPPQISSIIQGQLVQQQQVLQGPPLSRPLGFKRTPGVLLPGAGGAAGFGMTSPPPTSPSRTAVPPGLSSLPLTSVGNVGVKKAPKKLEEIPPASPEMAQMRKQCLDYHYQEMQALKEVFKEYLIELFFLQHFQGNMMDFLAFKERLYGPLQAYLRQNDLDIEEEEEEHFEVINDEVKVVARKHGQPGTPVAIATQLPPRTSAAFPAQQQPLQENQVHQCVAELRKAGVWSQRHLPKLQEAPQPKSHWGYLLEEMQWVATDFAQERRWKVASVKKMVRAVARQLQDRTRRGRDREGGAEQAETDGTSTTREIQHSWSSTAQIVEIKLQIEFQEKQKRH
uniref:HSA domain-containing protein n=1 Tax=Chlorocebus sabaeus TaxID=60711 RepID=A0A0D9S5M1_CHLSB